MSEQFIQEVAPGIWRVWTVSGDGSSSNDLAIMKTCNDKFTTTKDTCEYNTIESAMKPYCYVDVTWVPSEPEKEVNP